MTTRHLWTTAATALLIGIYTGAAPAQISFGVTQQNGVIAGGSLQIGGFVNPGRTGVVLGVSSGTSQLIGIQQFSVQNGGGNRAAAVAMNNRQRQNRMAEQFVKAAGRFDHDGNGRLDREELILVATAVVAELKQRQPQASRPPAGQPAKTGQPGMPPPPSDEQMVETFVTRCLTFDKDKDQALDAAETKRMAAALIRSLS
ncbi:MAG: hypothetical protein RIK87_22215 [Fuerstiella sp.]